MKTVQITNYNDMQNLGINNLRASNNEQPNLFKDIFPYSEIPKMVFNN